MKITGYICSCLSGRKTAGCCVHVTTLILYLSNSKYRNIKGPGEHLNSVFIDFAKKEPPNISRYVKNVRNKIEITDTSEYEDSMVSEHPEFSDLEDRNESHYEENNNLIVEENNISTENESASNNLNQIQSLSLKEFKSHVPEWGGNIIFEKKNIEVSDTCTIDYYLFSLWVIYRQKISIIEGYKSFDSNKYKIIKSIINNIERNNWNKAKELWIFKIMKKDKSSIDNNNISLFGSEDMMFFQYITNYQEYRLIQKCRQTCKKNNYIHRSKAKYIFFKKVNNILELFFGYTDKCSSCGKMISSVAVFTHSPTFVFIEPSDENILINELPKTIEINGKIFKLLCATIHTMLGRGHFVGIFNFNDNMLVVDDLDQSVKQLIQDENNYSKKSVTGSFYVLLHDQDYLLQNDVP
jgi:hypothetical protein